jgi:putative IMPACT (imprinted ancient) family translation regulator
VAAPVNSSTNSSSSSSATALPDTPRRAELRDLIAKIYKTKADERALCLQLSKKTHAIAQEAADSKDASATTVIELLIPANQQLLTTSYVRESAYSTYAGVLTGQYMERNGDITLLANQMFGSDDSLERQEFIQRTELLGQLLKM